jgi:hypothetical protein
MTTGNSQPADSFIAYVEIHERSWGNQAYPDRPGLADLLSAPVVVFWYPHKPRGDGEPARYPATIHADLDALDAYFTEKAFNRAEPAIPVPYRIFANQQRVRIKGLRLILDEG